MAFQVRIEPVDLSEPVVLPDPWPSLCANGFHADLLERARGFFLQARRLGYEVEASEFLRRIGEGFVNPFNAARFQPADDDPDREVKQKVLQALGELSDEFADRVPSTVWDTLAFLGTRANPREYTTILTQKEYLPHPWWLCDTMLHGMGKVYGFSMHVQSRAFQRAGVVLEHNCDCGCSIHEPMDAGAVCSVLPTRRFASATAALFSHLCGESLLIMALKLPFEMGLSPEAAEVMAYEPSPA